MQMIWKPHVWYSKGLPKLVFGIWVIEWLWKRAYQIINRLGQPDLIEAGNFWDFKLD